MTNRDRHVLALAFDPSTPAPSIGVVGLVAPDRQAGPAGSSFPTPVPTGPSFPAWDGRTTLLGAAVRVGFAG